MAEDIKELKKQIEDLKSELEASIKREEMKGEAGSVSMGRRVKNRIKRTSVWRAADNPNSRVGKVVRSPRTMFRILTNPDVAKDIKEKNAHIKNAKKGDKANIFMPIKFFSGESDQERINVVLEDVELELIEMGILLANEKGIEVRMITTKEKFDPVLYRKMVKDKKIPKAESISFYNTTEQNIRAKTFELEVSKNDIFLTKAWNRNDKD